MSRKLNTLAAACASLFAVVGQAAPLDANGQWHAFDVDDLTAVSGGLEWIDLEGNALDFSFSLASKAILRVVDAGAYSGDRFELFNGTSSMGLTSGGAAGGALPPPWTNFDAAFGDHAHYSYAELLLEPGSYDLRGVLRVSALDEFSQALNATIGAVSLTAVPVPGAGLLLSLASAVLGLAARRRHLV